MKIEEIFEELSLSLETEQYIDRLIRFNAGWRWQNCIRRLLNSYGANVGPVLDIGCGMGTFCNMVAQKNPETRVIGLEKNPEMALTAKALAYPNVTILEGDGDHLGACEKFGWVTCIHSISHMRDPEGVLQEIMNVLHPNGLATFVVPNRIFDYLMWPKNLISGYKGDPTIRHHWTPYLFAEMLDKAGFRSGMYFDGEYTPFLPRIERTRAWMVFHAWKKVRV